MTIGYYDTSKFKGPINWYPVKIKTCFGIELDDVLIGGKSMGFCDKKVNPVGCYFTVDSGSSQPMFPHFTT